MSNLNDNPKTDFHEDSEVLEEVKLPRMYRVMLLNDDYTTFDFVVYILIRFFHKSQAEAEMVTRKVHDEGKATAGVYSRDEAESRALAVNSCSRENNCPLLCEIEVDSE